jgi:4-hydroxybenzoyl-CoA thioesterase
LPFQTSRPLRFSDCDLTGIAYHPAYVDMLVGVNEDMFAAAGVGWRELMLERRMGLPTVTLAFQFARPAFYGDIIDFAVHVKAMGRSSLDLETVASVRGETIWTVQQRIVATSLDTHKSTPWPDDIRAGLLSYGES